MIDTKALRNKILDLAISGKLTEQLPEDGNAEDLIAINKDVIDENYSSDVPFKVPNNWVWCKLSDICETNIGLTYRPQDICENGTIVIRSSNIINNKMDYSDILRVKCAIKDKQYLNNNDIVICVRNGSKALIGKCALYKEKEKSAFGAFMSILRTPYFDYVFFYLQTSAFRRYFSNDDTKQINQITQAILKNALIPLPPLAEQKRIVSTVEDAFAILDEIEKAQKSYYADQEVLKNKIIEAGIRGKLTEQLFEDGNAEDLYAQIQEEKERLISEGKIRKDKPLPPIAENETPFEIPQNWKWVRFGDVMKNRDSERIPVSVADRKKLKKTYDYYGASGVIDKVEDYLFDGKLLLIGEDGANLLSRSTPIAFLAEGKYWVNNHAHVLDCYVHDYLDFVMFYINSISLVPYVTGAAQPKLNQENMNKIPVPLPPYEEQKRIVKRINAIILLL